MKRNLIIVACVSLGLLALMVLGNIIVVGEKIASFTHLGWMEWVFHGILFCIFAYLVLLPIWRIHRAPALPLLAVNEDASVEQLKAYGKLLVKHCDFIEDATRRKEHKKKLADNLLHAAGSHNQLFLTIKQELNLRKDGCKEKGILGINGQIEEWAKSVFMISAISQNSKFDTISVMWMNYKMIESLVFASGFRPNNRQLFKIYCNVLATALITYAMSEALMKTPAFKPFDIGEIHDDSAVTISDSDPDSVVTGETGDLNPDDVTFDAQMDDTEGLSLYSILRRVKIPGVVVGSAIDGTVNALMTLRIGFITRTYLQEGEEAFTGIRKKRTVKLQAMKDSLFAIPAVVASGSAVVGKKTSKFIIKLIEQNMPKEKN